MVRIRHYDSSLTLEMLLSRESVAIVEKYGVDVNEAESRVEL